MKKRTFMLRPPFPQVDYRDDLSFLGVLEAEIKLASRFFVIVDFINENIVDADGKIPEEDILARESMAGLGVKHWQKAKKIMQLRQEMDDQFGSLDDEDEVRTESNESPGPSRSR
jgi:hypothetical protein